MNFNSRKLQKERKTKKQFKTRKTPNQQSEPNININNTQGLTDDLIPFHILAFIQRLILSFIYIQIDTNTLQEHCKLNCNSTHVLNNLTQNCN